MAITSNSSFPKIVHTGQSIFDDIDFSSDAAGAALSYTYGDSLSIENTNNGYFEDEDILAEHIPTTIPFPLPDGFVAETPPTGIPTGGTDGSPMFTSITQYSPDAGPSVL